MSEFRRRKRGDNKAKRERARRRKPEVQPQEPFPYTQDQVNRILFPMGQDVELTDGTKLHVKPWSIRMMGEISQRIPELIEAAFRDKDADAVSLIPRCMDEAVYMVARTIEWTEEEVHERMTAEEFLVVALAVWRVCVEGSVGKMATLAGRVMVTVVPHLVPAVRAGVPEVANTVAAASRSPKTPTGSD